MRITIAQSIAEIDRLRPAWESLFAANESATMFQSLEWNRMAAHFFRREAPFIVFAEDADSGTALLPAAVTSDGLAFLGEALFDYRDGLACGSDIPWRAAWAKLAELRLPLSLVALRGAAACVRWGILKPAPFVNAPQVLRQSTTADGFAKSHSRLGRTLRLLAKRGAAFHSYNGSASGLVQWIFEQKARAVTSERNLFLDVNRIRFMVAICAANPKQCEISTLEAEGKPIAAIVTFLDRGVRRFYTIWFDSAWARLSPGTALVYEVTRRSLAQDLDCDYMTGEQPHKMRFATSVERLYRVIADSGLVAMAGGKDRRHSAA